MVIPESRLSQLRFTCRSGKGPNGRAALSEQSVVGRPVIRPTREKERETGTASELERK